MLDRIVLTKGTIALIIAMFFMIYRTFFMGKWRKLDKIVESMFDNFLCFVMIAAMARIVLWVLF